MSERHAILDALRRMKLSGAKGGERLTGGVSSDIWRIDLPSGPIYASRPVMRWQKLRVAAVGMRRSERNVFEARWMRHAAGFCSGMVAWPGCGERHVGDGDFSSPEDHPLWKNQLRDGIADAGFAAHVAEAHW